DVPLVRDGRATTDPGVAVGPFCCRTGRTTGECSARRLLARRPPRFGDEDRRAIALLTRSATPDACALPPSQVKAHNFQQVPLPRVLYSTKNFIGSTGSAATRRST